MTHGSGATPAARSADRWFVATFAVLAVATVLPIWIAKYLPLLDLPNHLTAVAVWHYHDDPAWDFAQYYDLNLVPLPYWAHYYTVHLLTYVTRSVEVANKIFLTGYALALPLGALAFARRFGRSRWLALFAFPLVWNFNLADGFIAYCAGFAAVPWALVVVDVHCERPTWRTALAVAAIGTLTYFFHLLAYALFLTCAGVVVLMQRRALDARLFALRSLPVLSAAGIGVWALRHANKMNFRPVTGAGRDLIYDPLAQRLAQIPERLINFVPGQIDEIVLVVLVVCWLALVVTAARAHEQEPHSDEPPRLQPQHDERQHEGLHGWRVEACVLAALALYLVAPRSMQKPFYWHMINGRFVVALALFAVLAVRGRIDGWRRWLLAPVAVASLVYTVALCDAFRTFNQHAAGFDEVVEKLPRGKRVLTMILRPMGDPTTVNVSAFNQFPSYVQLRRGGYNFYNFAEGYPLRYRYRLPAPPWSHAEEFRWGDHGPTYDYFVVFREGWEYDPMKGPREDGKVRLVTERGVWKLYEKIA
ncbi:MAG: hypothetical protein JWM53_4762, partial [bacterium]|nr:hypothetical protein [bacterium]